MYEERVSPVKEGETYEVSIDAVGGKGDGIAKIKGFVLFVPNTQKGDYVKIKVTKILKNSGFAEVVQKLDRPVREKKYETVSFAELNRKEEAPKQQYEDTEDFGDEL